MALSRNAYFDQKVYIAQVGDVSAQQLYGVQGFDGSWELPLVPVKAAGYGYVGTAAQGEMQGSVSVSRLITESGKTDPVINYSEGGGLLDKPISGFLSYGTGQSYDKAFYFNQGRITSYASACSVGSVATSDISLSIYGEMGSGDFAGTSPARNLIIARPGDITLNVADSTTNAIQSYDLNINLDWSPLQGIGSGMKPIAYRLNYPLEISVNFEMIVNSYESRDFFDLLCAPQVETLEIALNNCALPIVQFNITSGHLQGTSLSSSIGDNLVGTVSYIAYVNTAAELAAVFPSVT